MKKILFLLSIIPIYFFQNSAYIYAQDNFSKNGVCETFYENGNLKSKGIYLNNKKEGLHQWWYSNGSIEREGLYINGKKDGLYKWWYPNGQLYIMGEYKGGILLDKNICYDMNGYVIDCKQF